MSQETEPTGNNKDIHARTRSRRKITESTIEAIAALVSRGLTATEACHQMNVRPKTFFNFTSAHRKDVRFNELLERYKAMRVADLVTQIEKSARGDGMKQRDWRAARFLLEVLDRERFNVSMPAPAPQPATPFQIQIGIAAGLDMYKQLAARQAATVSAPAETKALPAPTGKLPAMFDEKA